MYVSWADPVGITVSSEQVNTSWSWNGSCVTGLSGSYSNYWFGADGWKHYGPSGWDNYYSCGSTTVSERNGQDVNSNFCPYGPVDPTYAIYNYVTVHGQPNGSITSEWSDYVSGGCTSLLHATNILEGPYGGA